MRPIALTIEGLTSYRHRQEIDFTDLDLFVITGPTGAGKSSILDAMTLALYGNVARVNGHELKDLISHGQSHMRVQFDFAVDGEQFRVARVFSRTRPQAISFERLEDGALSPVLDKGRVKDISQKIEELIGLDFSAFTKAVLLPQGEFAAFLKGDGAERRKTLVRLLDLDRYDRAGQVARRHVAHLDAVIGEREALIDSDYADATAEQRDELKRVVGEAKVRHAAVTTTKEQATTLVDAAAETTTTIRRVEALIEQLDDANATLDLLDQRWADLAASLESATETREVAERAFQADTEVLAKARTRLAQTVAKTGNAATLASLAAAARAAAFEEETLKILIVERTTAEQILTATATASADAVAQEAAASADVQGAQDNLAAAQQRLEHTKVALQYAERTGDLARIDAELVRADKQASEAQAKATNARATLEHLRAQHLAVGLRVGLQPGEPCPVCEVVIETVPPSDEGLEHLFTKAQSEAEACRNKERDASDAAVSLRAERKRAASELSKTQAQLPKGYAAAADIKTARADQTAAQKDVKLRDTAERAATATARTASKQLVDARSKASAAEAALAGVKTAIKQADSRKSTAVETLQASLGKKLPADPVEEIERRTLALGRAEEALDSAQVDADRSRDARDETDKALAEARAGIARFETDLAAVRTSANGACVALATEIGSEGLPKIPDHHEDHGALTAAWRACGDGYSKAAGTRLRVLQADLDKAATRISKLAEEVGIELSSTTPLKSLANFTAALIDAHGAVVGAEKDLAAHLKRMETRERLEKEIANERKQRTLYSQLADELRANRFVGFVLEESMSHLADQASVELLRISDGRYSLAAEGGNFDVIDHTNADERRTVATLSGGETFLASLSLALALSVGLREFARTAAARLDAIFIDEGFGALDPDTLDVVVDALERLRDGDRMVGVITHVPTLAERITSGLRVEASGGSSRVVVRI